MASRNRKTSVDPGHFCVNRADSPLSYDDINLLHALATAPTLAAAATAVGQSRRHTRRRTAELLNRMGVRSNRAAVAVAAARGYIHEPPSSL
ncbi:MAG: hypothetical protein ACC683_04935 [Acidimicrobiia bacterium]